MSHTTTPALTRVQRVLAHGYDFPCVQHCVLTVQEPRNARAFLAALAVSGHVADASQSRAEVHGAAPLWNGHRLAPIAVGLTFAGLQALGLSERYADIFRSKAPAFSQGAALRAAQYLGDAGASDPTHWEDWSLRDQAHVILVIHAARLDDIGQTVACLRSGSEFRDAFTAQSWDRCTALQGEHFAAPDPVTGGRRVHFGYLDGLSNPFFTGVTRDKKRALLSPVNIHSAGELLLGHPTDSGANPWLLPFELPTYDPARLPGSPAQQSELRAFFQDGSFGIVRKIEQDEVRFRKAIESWIPNTGEPRHVWRSYLRAKLLGRWDDGSLVLPGAQKSAGASPDVNQFDFSQDRFGQGCPFGAHIRRMNPRSDPVVPVRRRPLVRRGVPYGPIYHPDEKPDAQPVRRGLLGLFFCADIEDQFEHLMGDWADMNPMGTPSQSRSKDPLIGHHENPDLSFDLPLGSWSSPERLIDPARRKRLVGFSPYVTTKGTLYAFFPNIEVLRNSNAGQAPCWKKI